MKRLAMSWGEGYVNRFGNQYLTQSDIDHLFHQSNVDFFTGIYSPPFSLCPRKYHRETIQCLPLSGPLIFDVDAHTPEQKKTTVSIVKTTAQKLDSLGAHYVIFHSGRGFHFDIPSTLDIVDLPVAHKIVAQKIIDQADTSIYVPSGTIRYPNSLNSKSRTYKVPVCMDDLDDHEQLIQKLSHPTEIPRIEPSQLFDKFILDTFHWEIAQLKAKIKPYQGKSYSLTQIPHREKLSFFAQQTLQSAKIQPRTRHKTTFSLCLELKEIGLDKEQSQTILLSWANHVLQNRFTKSNQNEVITDTNSVINYIYSHDTLFNVSHFKEQVRENYVKQFHNRKKAIKWKDNLNECKVYCVFKAVSLVIPRFFLSYSMIREISGLNKLCNGKSNYIKKLLEKRYIDTIDPMKVSLFVPRKDDLPDTLCYEVLI